MIKINLKRTAGDFGFEATDASGHVLKMDTSTESGGVDFGIRHVFSCDDTAFTNTLETLTHKSHDKIRIASIWNLQHTTSKNIYQEILWYFAGGVFGGSKEKILVFADLMKEKCLQIIHEKQTLMWEVNIWYLIYLENKELFDCYYCDHNNTIVANY